MRGDCGGRVHSYGCWWYGVLVVLTVWCGDGIEVMVIADGVVV